MAQLLQAQRLGAPHMRSTPSLDAAQFCLVEHLVERPEGLLDLSAMDVTSGGEATSHSGDERKTDCLELGLLHPSAD